MEEIIAGVTRTYSHDTRIVIYSVSSLGVTTLKSWSDDILANLEHWPQEYDSYLVVYDLSDHGVSLPFLVLTGYNIYNPGITSAGQKRLDALLQARPGLMLKLALVLSPSLSGDMALNRGRQPATAQSQVECQVYFDQAAAVTWLEQFIPT